jgi:hypothetical protein
MLLAADQLPLSEIVQVIMQTTRPKRPPAIGLVTPPVGSAGKLKMQTIEPNRTPAITATVISMGRRNGWRGVSLIADILPRDELILAAAGGESLGD